MGMAMAVYKIYPEEGVDLTQLEAEIKKIEKVREVKREEIGFGIVLLKVAIVVDDKKDNPQQIEDKIRATKGVKDMENEGMNLIS